jgi:hypothetical protein
VDGEEEEDNDEDITEELQEIADQDGANEATRDDAGDVIELQQVQQLEELPQLGTPGIQPEIAPIAGVRRSSRTKLQTASYVPSMKGQKYNEALFNQMQMESPKIVATVMTQLSMKAGLKAWGDPAKSAVKEEMQQLHMRDTFQNQRPYRGRREQAKGLH